MLDMRSKHHDVWVTSIAYLVGVMPSTGHFDGLDSTIRFRDASCAATSSGAGLLSDYVILNSTYVGRRAGGLYTWTLRQLLRANVTASFVLDPGDGGFDVRYGAVPYLQGQARVTKQLALHCVLVLCAGSQSGTRPES